MAGLLSTKLRRPEIPLRRVERARLVECLDKGLQAGHQLSLVSAPAGFGKTTCVCEWASGLGQRAAWLSLDPADDEPGRFLTYLIAALRQVDEGLGAEIEGVLRAGLVPPVEVVSTSLINDMLDLNRRCVLVLDDFHLIQNPYIVRLLETLVTNLPPALHLVLLTREDPALPLARLRANDRLTEIRAADLRLSREEMGAFLNEVMDLGLPDGDIQALAERTEGWVVGLKLAALAMQGPAAGQGPAAVRKQRSNFIANLSGSHRFILSYLTEEVVNQQPEDVRQFLLQTAILERLNGDLCDAVTGRQDSRAVLEQLYHANLFLIPLDDEQRWYRYHHLFADLLRSRLSALQREKTAELHQRASQWHTRACAEYPAEQAELAGEAVRHALAAEDYPAAVRLIEAHVMDMLNRWYVKPVSGWMRALPPEWSARSPRTNLAFARMHLINGDFPLAGPYLERMRSMFAAAQAGEDGAQITPALRAEWLALQSTLAGAQGETEQALMLAQQALAEAPEQDDHTMSQVYMALAAAHQSLDQHQSAEEAYRRLIGAGRAAGNLISEALGLSALALMLIQRGRLREGFAAAKEGAERLERSGVLPPMCAGIYGELGVVHAHWNQLDLAEQYLERAAQVSALGGSDAAVYFAIFRSRLRLMRGDPDGAAREIQKAADILRMDKAAVVREEAAAQQVQVALARNDPAAAELVLTGLMGGGWLLELAARERIGYPQGVLYISALRVLLHRARTRSYARGDGDGLQRAVEQAGRLLERLAERQYVPLMLETLLVRGQLHAAKGDARASLEDFSAAVDLAEPEGYISLFIMEGQPVADALALLLKRSQPGSARAEFIQSVLNAFSAAPAGQPEQKLPDRLYETLTGREVEVLRLMAEGQTYEEIAGVLVVSINTVRTHVKAVYGKLGVNNRTAAIEAARRGGLL